MSWYRCERLTMILVVALGWTLGACSDDTTTPAEPEPPPEVPTVTRTFMGTIEQDGFDCKNFSMDSAGDVVMEVVDFRPLASITMGLTLGMPDAEASRGCASIATDESVRVSEPHVSAGLPAGTYCVCLFDVGNIFPDETVGYDLEVTHPEQGSEEGE